MQVFGGNLLSVAAVRTRPMTLAGQKGRVALRVATHSLHERLHGAPDFAALAQGTLDIAGYAGLLSRQASCYFAAAKILPLEPGRLELLHSDLATLGAEQPEPLDWPNPAGPPEALGWRYVVEGSIFGGRVIYRQLDYLFGDRSEGRSFFRGTPQSTARWQALCSEIEQEARSPLRLNRIIEGAIAAFTAFGRILDIREPACA